MDQHFVFALMGGALIGIAVSLMMFLNGRVTGISGIVYGLTSSLRSGELWRWYFIGGLITGGIVLKLLRPEVFTNEFSTPNWSLSAAGFLVGFGTVLANGCTSGHGVCGVSRLSIRSLLATLLFICSGIVIVIILNGFGVYQ